MHIVCYYVFTFFACNCLALSAFNKKDFKEYISENQNFLTREKRQSQRALENRANKGKQGKGNFNKKCRGGVPGFRCATGPNCVQREKVCDGQYDCSDHSDESPFLCNNQEETTKHDKEYYTNFNQYEPTAPPYRYDGCLLPPQPNQGSYLMNGYSPEPGTFVDIHTIIIFKCNDKHTLKPEHNAILYCQTNATWNNDPPKCIVTCPKLSATSVEITYSKLGYTVDGNQPILPDTIASFKCKHSYRPPPNDPNYRDIACLSTGKWNRPIFECAPICGTEIPIGQTLIISGHNVEVGQFPWHVGIYRGSDGVNFDHICGGTLISPRLIISAAHCFYDETIQRVNINYKYAIGAGKFYRDWKIFAKDPYAQLRIVPNENIRLPNEYRGSRTSFRSDISVLILEENNDLQMTDLVRPVCVDWDLRSELQALQAGSLGKVAGWGKTQETGKGSTTLKTLTVPFIPTFPDCYNSVPASFQPYLQEDKICAGYNNGSSVCEGDSGGGLVFQNKENNLWYIRGIVSIDPIKGTTCDAYSYSGYTKFSFHIKWLRSISALYI